MADTGTPDDGTTEGTDDTPSLEMPSFSLRRKKKAPAAATDAEPEPTPEPTPEPVPAPTTEPEPAVVDERRAYEPPAEEHPTAPIPAADTPIADVPVVAEEPVDREAADREPRPKRELPSIALSGIPAAAVTGVAVGAIAVLLAWLSTSACDVVRGTSSCGGGPGLLLLVVVLVAMAYVGSVLLRIFSVPDAGSTSVLAVGILAVLVLVFLLGSIDQWWMVIAIPLAAVIAYCASWWVTHAVVGDEDEPAAAEPRDIR